MDFVGLSASIVTILELGWEVVVRIQEFSDPESPLSDLSLRLPLQLQKVDSIKKTLDNHACALENPQPLKQALDGYKRQLQKLNSILVDVAPRRRSSDSTTSDSKLSIAVKAVRSVYKERKLDKLQKTLQSYESTFSLFFTDHEKTINANGASLFYEVPPIAADRFVGRLGLLKQIGSVLSVHNAEHARRTTAVLVGLGGQGKTQLALEFCRQMRNTHSIIYLNGLSPRTLQRSFERLVSKVAGIGFDSIDVAAERTYRALDDSGTPYIVLLDNFDRPKDFDNIEEYLPNGKRSRTIITSRNHFCSALGETVEVTPMNVDDAVELLLDRCEHHGREEIDISHARVIVEELGRLPLAIDQASSYIRARSLPFRSFLEHYSGRKSSILKKTPDIWKYTRKLLDSERETHLSVFTTWELSFDSLGDCEEERTHYAHILTLAAFIDFTCVGSVFFEAYCKTDSGNASGVTQANSQAWDWNPFDYQDAIVLFKSVSLVEGVDFGGHRTTFSLHPLVAEWLRNRLSPTQRYEYIQEIASTLQNFAREFLFSTTSLDFTDLREMQSHLDRLTDNKGLGPVEQDVKFLSMHNSTVDLGRFYVRFRRFDEAETFVRTCLASSCDAFERAGLQCLIGEILLHRGDIEAADREIESSVELAECVFGPNHSETMRAVERLAFCRYTQSRFDDAESLYSRSMQQRQSSQGLYHVETLNSTRMLGETYRLQKRFDLALPLMIEAQDGFIKSCGSDHFRTAMGMSSLATWYRDQGEYQRAQKMFEVSFGIFERTFGPNNSRTSGAKIKIGFIWEDQQEFTKARNDYVYALRSSPCTDQDFNQVSASAAIAQARRLIKDFNYQDGILARAISQAAVVSQTADDTLTNTIAALQEGIG